MASPRDFIGFTATSLSHPIASRPVPPPAETRRVIFETRSRLGNKGRRGNSILIEKCHINNFFSEHVYVFCCSVLFRY